MLIDFGGCKFFKPFESHILLNGHSDIFSFSGRFCTNSVFSIAIFPSGSLQGYTFLTENAFMPFSPFLWHTWHVLFLGECHLKKCPYFSHLYIERLSLQNCFPTTLYTK